TAWTSPAGDTVTTVISLDRNVTGAPAIGCPTASRTVAVMGWLSPGLMTSALGFTTTDGGTCEIDTGPFVDSVPLVTVIVAAPSAPTDVTHPKSVTVTRVGSLDANVSGAPSTGSPFASLTTADSCRESPRCRTIGFGVTVTELGTRVTSASTVPVSSPS